MSMGIMLQTESKRTLAGWLWLILILISTLALYFFSETSITSENLLGHISLYLIITSFFVVAIITIRPEKWFNKIVIGKSVVPPFFTASEAPSIYDVADSAFITKELDNFYGNCLVLIGFFFGILFPLHRIIGLGVEDFWIFEILKGGMLVSFIYLLVLELRKQKKDLREHIEIVWRYTSIIAQQGWEVYYSGQTNALENSIKTKNWDKARYQINSLDRLYLDKLRTFSLEITVFLQAFQFILGVEEYRESHQKHNFGSMKKIISQATVLGFEYHNSEMQRNLQKRIDEYKTFNIRFNNHYNKITNNIKELESTLQSKDGEHDFRNLSRKMDFWFFHIDSREIDLFDLSSFITALIAQSSEDNRMKELFMDVKNATDLYNNLTKEARMNFRQEIEVTLGKDAIRDISSDINKIQSWIFPEIERCYKILNSS